LGEKSSSFSNGSGGLEHGSKSINPRTPGARRSVQINPSEERGSQEDDKDHIEEIFGQLWAISKPTKPRVQPPVNGGYLAWVRRELVEADRVSPKDCFPVSRF
jgi:hypothetical protein